MKLLLVCSRNQWRSRTAEEIFKNHPVYDVRSAGTEPSARIRVSEKLVNWADYIFVMEKKHKQRLLTRFPNGSHAPKIEILHILDDYPFMDEELIELLQNAMEDFFE